jgi:tripartite-type tricarboxylate transporter receptor subunit TctC
MKQRTFLTLLAAVGGTLPVIAAAQSVPGYPAKAIRLIVPFPPGGSTDLMGRVLGAKLGETFNQQVIVENRPGASGMIGNELVARATPDGHMLTMGTIGAMSVNQSLFKSVPYDSTRDFAPVTLTGNVENLLVVHPSVPVQSVKDLITLAAGKPGMLIFASSGIGNAPHLAGELFNQLAKVKMVHLPYKGGGPAMIDLVAGQVSLSFASMPSSLPFAKSGKLRAIAVGGTHRSPAAPEIPTVAENGLPGFAVTDWQGLLAAVIERLNRETIRILNERDIKDRLSAAGLQVATNTPAQFADFIRSEIDKWGRVIRAAGIKPE